MIANEDGKWIMKECMHPNHKPPGLIVIPAGQTHTHICPACGQKTTMTGSKIRFC